MSDAPRIARSKYRKVGSPVGEILDGLLTSRGWSLRDLENATRSDNLPGYVSHQCIGKVIRGTFTGKRVLDRLLAPFGYRAIQEVRLEPIERYEEDGA